MNTAFLVLQNRFGRFIRSSAATGLLLAAALPALAATKTWDGGGADGNWTTGGNWDANLAPVAGDSLVFGNTTRLHNTNNFPAGTGFGGISFNSPAGAFSLFGSALSLNGDLFNNQPVVTETINLPLTLTGHRNAHVGTNAALSLAGVISGGFGLSKSGEGLLTLSGANLYTGPTRVNAGVLGVSADGNLGAVPALATAGSLVLSNGTLRSTASFTLNANRGIALGPVAGAGEGAFDVPINLTLTYHGIIANNGGTGGLRKSSFGGLTLSGANTYTGPTAVRNGTLTLDFTQASSPANNVVSSTSTLILGGETAGVGTVNNSTLVMNPGAGETNSQTFADTLIDIGPAVIQANANGASTANIVLGDIAHNIGGVVNLVPPTLRGGSGDIKTTSGNENGILGGWATISDGTIATGWTRATNWASVDANGNIVNYAGHTVYTAGMVKDFMHGTNNLVIPNTIAGDLLVDADGAGSTLDVNTIIFDRNAGWTFKVGNGNTIRLGKTGALFNRLTVAGPTWVIGDGSAGANVAGTQGSAGRLTAGGPNPNTPGELIFINTTTGSGSANNWNIDSQIVDNGSGAVSVVKAGSGYIKLRNTNTFSGGLYLLGGRVQLAGSEIGGLNPTGVGTGPIFIFPGAYLYCNPNPGTLTNPAFISGTGTPQETGLGGMRLANGCIYSGPITLIGDARLCGQNNNNGGNITGPITGPHSLILGNSGSINGNVTLSNPDNSWSGNTMLVARNNTGNNNIINGGSEVIPHGFGNGNVVMQGFSVGTVTWNLNGFNETINGLTTTDTGASCIILNNGAGLSTLTVGGNDQSGDFDGSLRDGTGILALTKTGGGIFTLTGANTYTGDTTVSQGTLALAGLGSITSPNVSASGGAFDVSGSDADFVGAGTLSANNGTIRADDVNVSSPSLNLSDAGVTVALNPAEINFTTTTLATGGATNRINISAVVNISGYPTDPITVIDYDGAISGSGFNFGLGEVPSPVTVGYVSNDIVNTRIVVVLLNGPKPLTWRGNAGRDWDEGTSVNWLAFKGTPNEGPAAFFTADTALFDDSGLTNNINLIGSLQPGGVFVNNSALNYTFTGSGGLSGLGALTKQGTGTLTLANTGNSDLKGGVNLEAGSLIFATDNTISGGVSIFSGATLQVGTNGGTGTLPAGVVANEGSLIFNRGAAAYTVGNVLGGSGSLTKNDAAVLTLGGANTSLTGAVAVVSGTLRISDAGALGTADGGTVISSGATLDVGGQVLNTEPVTVSGTGVSGLGAIINSGADQINALGNVTLAGSTTFGGTGRFDIRGGAASLSTSGQAHNLTLNGTNQFSLVGVTVDGALANINVGNGSLFSVETSTTGLGNPASTLTVASGGTLQFWSTTVAWDKVFVLNGNGATNTVNNGAGSNTVAGAVTLTGHTIFNVGGTALNFDGAIGGTGSLRKTGASPLTLNGNNSYSGGTTNAAGSLFLNGNNTGGGTLLNLAGASLGGRGTHSGPVLGEPGSSLLPGGNATAGTFGTGPLTLSSARVVFELGTNDVNNASPFNDLVSVTGNLTLQGVTTNFILTGPVGSVAKDAIITLYQFTGSLAGGTNNLALVAPTGYEFAFLDPATTPGAIRVRVVNAPANLVWRGHVAGSQTLWDIGTTTNWLDGAALSDYRDFDTVVFDDTASSSQVSLTTTLAPGSVTMNNTLLSYKFSGPGRLTGDMSLSLQGGGSLVLANLGSNDFTGAVNSSGTLQVGDGGSAGNLGSGPITNEFSLVFHRSGELAVNSLHGGGSISNLGSGVVTIGGANTYNGFLTVAAGTVRAASGTALGSDLSPTTVESGGTLDVGGQVLNLEPVTVSGAGVGGAGAIINSGADQINALGNVTLMGHTVFGGTGRWDIRGGVASLSTFGSPFNLTKVGPNQVSLVGVIVDFALADILVQEGTFSFETTTTSLGNPANTLSVAAGATFQMFGTVSPVDKSVQLAGDGIANTVNVPSGTQNQITGPVTLTGPCVFNVTGANALSVFSDVGGGGELVKNGTGALNLSGNLTYAGNTTVGGGALVVSGPATLNNSPVITVGAGAVLDVQLLNSGPTLSLASGQTLQGHGAINGGVSAAPGATVAPGMSAGVLTVTNEVTLQGTTIMEVQTSPLTNDRIRSVLGTITYGGTLVITNVGSITGSNVFKLFEGNLAGNFANVVTPTLPGVTWNTANLTVDGTVTAIGTVNTSPVNLGFSLTGNALEISWPADHTGWRLEGQTNSVSVGLSDNWVNVTGAAGTNRVLVPVNPANGSVFYRLVYP